MIGIFDIKIINNDIKQSDEESAMKRSLSGSPALTVKLAVCVQLNQKIPAHSGSLFCSYKSFFLFLHFVESTTLAVTDQPTSQQVSVQVPYSHIGARQFSDGVHFLPFCLQRSWLSLRCGPLRSVDSHVDVSTYIVLHKHSPKDCLSACHCFFFTVQVLMPAMLAVYHLSGLHEAACVTEAL